MMARGMTVSECIAFARAYVVDDAKIHFTAPMSDAVSCMFRHVRNYEDDTLVINADHFVDGVHLLMQEGRCLAEHCLMRGIPTKGMQPAYPYVSALQRIEQLQCEFLGNLSTDAYILAKKDDVLDFMAQLVHDSIVHCLQSYNRN